MDDKLSYHPGPTSDGELTLTINNTDDKLTFIVLGRSGCVFIREGLSWCDVIFEKVIRKARHCVTEEGGVKNTEKSDVT